MSNLQTPFRYDFVGSFLRPEKLKKARRQFNEGKIDAAALKKVEDEAITELVSKIKELGYHVITDGEFRRATWHLDFMWGFDGIGHTPTKTGLPFHGEAAMVDDTYIVGKIGLTGEHPFVDHFRFVKALEDENTVAKQTIPSPAQFLAQFTMPFNRGCTEKHYPNEQELVNDIVAAYGKVIDDLYAAGCRNLQLDDCTWGMFADKIGHTLYGTTREGIVEFQKAHKDINNKVIANAPKDMIINTHVCRGNFHSTYASEGAYDSVADILFGEENVPAVVSGASRIFLRLVRHRFHLRGPAGLHLGRRSGLTGGSRRRRSAGTVTGIRDLSPSDLQQFKAYRRTSFRQKMQ